MAKSTRQDIERARPLWSEEFKRLNPGLVSGAPLESAKTTHPAAPSPAPAPISAPVAAKSPLAVKFEELWERFGGPLLEPEVRFHEKRRWRFDYAIPRAMIAIELEGGIHKRRGHAGPEGYIKDCRKYNAATADGWRVFRLASGMMTDEDVGALAATARRLLLATEDFSC